MSRLRGVLLCSFCDIGEGDDMHVQIRLSSLRPTGSEIVLGGGIFWLFLLIGYIGIYFNFILVFRL